MTDRIAEIREMAKVTCDGSPWHAASLEWMRNDIPYLLAQLDAARAEVERLRAVVDKMPKAADGVPVTIGMDAWIVVREDPEYWGVKSIGEAVCEKVTSICEGSAFREYSGTFTIGSRNWEGGNLDIYSTREAAEAAKEKP